MKVRLPFGQILIEEERKKHSLDFSLKSGTSSLFIAKFIHQLGC